MPKVPYAPYPTTGPVGPTGRALSVSGVSADAFGGDVAQAIGGLGREVERSSDKLWNRAVAIQQLQNESEAREADAEFMEASAKARAQYHTLQGEAAVKGLEPHIAELRTLREGVRARLTTDQSRKMYDGQTLGFLGRNVYSAASHAATENRKWAAGASEARIQGVKDYVYQQPDDVGALEDGLRLAEREVRGTQAPIAGWSKEQTDEAVKKTQSDMIQLRITGLARTNPEGAKEMLDTYRSRLTPAAAESADKVVLGQLRSAGSRMLASKFGATDLSKPIEQVVEQGTAAANKIAPDDPVLADFVRDRIIADRNRAKSLKADTEFANRQVIEGALVGATRDGKIPTTPEELFAMAPGSQEAWESLDPSRQRQYLKVLASNAKGDTAWTADGLKRYQTLKGQAHSDAAGFLDTDVTAENLPWSARRELVNLQERMKKNASGDPRVQRALGWLRAARGAEMEALGIFRRTETNKEEYDAFVGSVADSLDLWQQGNKKAPNYKEVTEDIGSEILRQRSVPGTVFGRFWPNKYTVWNTPIPQEDVDKFKAKVRSAGGDREPSDEEARRAIIRARLLELYGAKRAGE